MRLSPFCFAPDEDTVLQLALPEDVTDGGAMAAVLPEHPVLRPVQRPVPAHVRERAAAGRARVRPPEAIYENRLPERSGRRRKLEAVECVLGFSAKRARRA